MNKNHDLKLCRPGFELEFQDLQASVLAARLPESKQLIPLHAKKLNMRNISWKHDSE